MSIMSDLKKSFDADREALMKGMDAYREELREMDPEKPWYCITDDGVVFCVPGQWRYAFIQGCIDLGQACADDDKDAYDKAFNRLVRLDRARPTPQILEVHGSA